VRVQQRALEDLLHLFEACMKIFFRGRKFGSNRLVFVHLPLLSSYTRLCSQETKETFNVTCLLFLDRELGRRASFMNRLNLASIGKVPALFCLCENNPLCRMGYCYQH